MATIRKRGKGYQIDYFDPSGKRVRKSFKKKKDAATELGKRVLLIAEVRYLDVKKEFKTTLKDVLVKYEENFKNQSSYKNGKRFFVEDIREHFGENTLLANIRYLDLETYRGKRVDSVKTSFNAAVKRAGIVDFRFHDLRHTFASQLIMKGGTLKDVQELLGHSTMTMTLRYAHLTQEHKRKAVNLLNGLTGNCVTKLSQSVISAK